MMKILVVVDMQNDFITGALGNAECEAAVSAVNNVIGGGGYDRIILTRDTHTEEYMDTREGKHLPVPHCIEETEGWEIHRDVMEAVQAAKLPYMVIDKPTFGSVLLGSELAEVYATQGAELQVDFVGVCTGICVISNVMIAKATCPEAEIRVIEQACACVTPDSHKTAIDAMRLCQVEIV